MFTVPQFVAYVQTGVYAKGSKFKQTVSDDVRLTYAGARAFVLLRTERKIEFGVHVWVFR